MYEQPFATPLDALAHFGVKGMRWGVRRDDFSGATRRVNRDAAKDAREFARAKMFYGEGAGTRRKLIKAKVESKTKQNPTYRQAFDHHLSRENLGQHADRARGERRRKDASAKIGKTARGVNRLINGQFAAPIAATTIVASASYIRARGLDLKAMELGREFIRNYF